MSLKIYNVHNSNKPENEFVRLTTSRTINLKGYALIDKTFDEEGAVSNEFRHIYMFPDLTVHPGEFVRVYTGEGEYKESKHTTQGHTIHNLYWNSEKCVWNDKGGDRVTLIQFNIIDRKKVPEV